MALEEKCELHDERTRLENECTDERPKEATLQSKAEAAVNEESVEESLDRQYVDNLGGYKYFY